MCRGQPEYGDVVGRVRSLVTCLFSQGITSFQEVACRVRELTGSRWPQVMPLVHRCWQHVAMADSAEPRQHGFELVSEPFAGAILHRICDPIPEANQPMLPLGEELSTPEERECRRLAGLLLAEFDGIDHGEARARVAEFVVSWIGRQLGSPSEFVAALDSTLGWQARHHVLSVLGELRQDRELDRFQREYLAKTLTDEAIADVINNGVRPSTEERSTLDELFSRSWLLRGSEEFGEAIRFAARFREYSPFNNILVYMQNPMVTYYATERHWHREFGRVVKEDARAMVILAPMTPVLLVYDLDDTVGPPLPKKLMEFTLTEGAFDPRILEKTLANALREEIRVEFKPMGQLYGGFATTQVRFGDCKMRVVVREQLDPRSRYAVLCHELAHIFLGHLGADEDGWWPYRRGLTHRVVEVEAEAASYIVCSRLGIRTTSPAYLSTHIRSKDDLAAVSIDLITRVASRIEQMGQRMLAKRPKRKAPEET